jgi:hypothetical protein
MEELHALIRQEDLEGCRDWLKGRSFGESRELVNQKDKHERAALHLAAWKGNAPLIELLLEYKADVRAKARDDFTALHFCAQSGGAEGCRALVGAGAKLNAYVQKSSRTPLMIAAGKGHLEVCKVLVECGASIHLRGGNSRKQTAMDMAPSSEITDYLLGALRLQHSSESPAAMASACEGVNMQEQAQAQPQLEAQELPGGVTEADPSPEVDTSDEIAALLPLRPTAALGIVPFASSCPSAGEADQEAAEAKRARKRRRKTDGSGKGMPTVKLSCIGDDEDG